MKLKLDDNGAAVIQDGKPVYIKDDNTEVAFDVAGAMQSISRLNGEAKGHRERAETAEGRLKLFEGLDDPEAARKALATVSNLDAKKLIEAGEVDKVKAELTKAMQGQIDAEKARAEGFEKQLFSEMIGGGFSRSKFVAEKMAIPADMVQSHFGKHFSVEDGKVVAKDANGQKIFSPSNPGELAGFDEALQIVIGQYPNKEHILKGTGASGGGASGGGGGSGSKKRSEMTATEMRDYIAENGQAAYLKLPK